MSTPETLELPRLGEPGEGCGNCGAPLAPDQRYCLNCGLRRAEPRVDYERALGSPPAGPPPPGRPTQPAAPPPGGSPVTWPIAAGGAAVLVVALAMGVLIGNTTSGGKSSGSPQVITVGGAAGGAASGGATPAAAFKEDWPSGKNGWTVQLQALPKSGNGASQVAAAKQAASSKGAKDVGALDSDSHASLKGGFYVVYAGVFDSKKQAEKALAGLKKSFPDARVVQVGDRAGGSGGKDVKSLSGKKSATVDKRQLQQLNNLSPDQYQKQSKKLPSTLKLPGKPPPVDKSKPVGGGSPTETIK